MAKNYFLHENPTLTKSLCSLVCQQNEEYELSWSEQFICLPLTATVLGDGLQPLLTGYKQELSQSSHCKLQIQGAGNAGDYRCNGTLEGAGRKAMAASIAGFLLDFSTDSL